MKKLLLILTFGFMLVPFVGCEDGGDGGDGGKDPCEQAFAADKKIAGIYAKAESEFVAGNDAAIKNHGMDAEKICNDEIGPLSDDLVCEKEEKGKKEKLKVKDQKNTCKRIPQEVNTFSAILSLPKDGETECVGVFANLNAFLTADPLAANLAKNTLCTSIESRISAVASGDAQCEIKDSSGKVIERFGYGFLKARLCP